MTGKTRLMPRTEMLRGWGHGWAETWHIGDDEDPERTTLEECVWIRGRILMRDGTSSVNGEYWRKHYGRKYGVRVWRGEAPPTEKQRQAAPWGPSAREE